MKRGKHIALLAVLTAVLWAADSSAAVSLDQNEEIQRVIGDLSALKTAAQMFYSDNGDSDRVPPLPAVLAYFDEGSLPPDALSLYAIDGRDGSWYVGYKAYGLRNDTCAQLEQNADSLNIVGDNLLSPWRRGSAYIWSSALALSASAGSGGPVIRESRSDASDVAKVLIGAAVFINAIRHHRHNSYSYPHQPWRWHSSLRYHPRYRDRFYRHFRPPVSPRINRRPVPRYNEPPRWRRGPGDNDRPQLRQPRRPSQPRQLRQPRQPRNSPGRNREEYRRPGGQRGDERQNNRRPNGGQRGGRGAGGRQGGSRRPPRRQGDEQPRLRR